MAGSGRTLLLVNVDLHCADIGNGDGYPLIVHHGGPGLDHTVIAPHLNGLKEHFHLYCYDHRGTGRSAPPQGKNDPYHVDRFVEDIGSVAQAVDAPSFALMGHSFGGIVALKYAIAHPDAMSHLILVCAPMSADYVERMETALPERLDSNALAELSVLQDEEPSPSLMRRSLELLAPLYFHDPSRVSELHLDTVKFGPATQAVWDSLQGFDMRPLLPQVKVPTLVVVGSDDTMVSVEAAKATAEALPEGQLAVIQDAGHYPFVEKPQEFASAVLEFFGLKTAKKKGLFGRG